MNKLLRKLTAVVSAAAVAIAGVSFGGIAFAEDYTELCAFELTGTGYTIEKNYYYTVKISDGAELTIKNKNPEASTKDYIEVESGASANITLAGVNIGTSGCAFKIADDSAGNVTITLADDTENTLKSSDAAGLQKNGGTGTLTINGGENGTGKLTATGGSYSAGIGGGGSFTNAAASCSGIIINGGVITAIGDSYAAGIGGGGSYENTAGSCYDIIINGGTITATGGMYAAGIGGGGSDEGASGDGSDITITGGNVTATAGKYAAGIGGGGSNERTSGVGSNITITGGTVTANGGDHGAGIGGGGSLSYKGGDGSNITISGGNVFANGGQSGAGIGGGGTIARTKGGSGLDITISGGTVVAAGNSSTGIGGGNAGDCKGVTISGGTVSAIAANGGSGIGGRSFSYISDVSDIKITGGCVKTVTEKGSYSIGNGISETVPTNDNGENVYLRTYENTGDYPVKVDGADYTPINHKAADSADSNLYIYLTEGAHSVQFNVDGDWLDAPFVTPPVPFTNLQYTGEAQALVLAGDTTAGTLVYSLEENGAYTSAIPTATEVGTYTVWYKVESAPTNTGTTPKSVEAIISNELLSINAADGSELVKGEDYTYENSILTVKTNKPVVIANKDSETAIDHAIVIASGVFADVTLAGVNINVSAKDNTAAFLIEDGGTGTVCVNLADGKTNTLISGYGCAGLQKNDDNVKLVIDGNGTLNATGGKGSAGIGGGKDGSGSNITINGGTVNATSGRNDNANAVYCGAGIGGGYNGNGEHITINGGNVTAKSWGTTGSGIGGGYKGSGSYITVNGGIVYAEGANGAGIGGGDKGNGSYITITGGKVTATGSGNGSGIGGGQNGSGSNIKISGGTVKATAKNNGAGIGGGSEGSGSYITISGGTVTATGKGFSNIGGAGIGGGYQAEGSAIVITGGSVKAVSDNCPNKIGGGTDKAAVTPTLADMTTSVYLLEIANANGDDVSINGVKYPTHDDNYVYAYLPGDTSHTVRVGTSVTVWLYNTTNSRWEEQTTLTAPEAVRGLVYDGKSQKLITAGETASGTMSYSTEKDGTYTTALPTGKDASTYEVWYKVTLGETVIAGPDCVEVKIARKSVTVTAADKSKDFGETDPALTYEAVGLITGEALTGELTRAVGENVGTYAIKQGTLTNENNPNYDITFNEGTLTVNPADISAATAEQVDAFTYNGRARTPVFSVTLGGTELTAGDCDIAVTSQTNAGEYAATITGKGNYTGTVSNATWTIDKAAVTITANSYTVKVGDALPTLDYKVSGLVNNEALPITVTISCTASDSTTAGTFPIRVSGADESTNYAFTYVNGTLTITAKKVQTITADDVTLTYGETGKKIGAATNGDGAISYAVTTGSDVISVAADGAITVLKAGTATVEITAAETEVYAKATKTVTVTVNKVAVTITANSYTIKVGDALPTFEYKVTGLASNEALPITVTISCTATDSNTAGTFRITVSGAAESTNHAFTYVNGTLKITSKEIQTITAYDVTLTYGETGKKIAAATSGDGAISYAVKTGDDVITVAADGAITALKAGVATVEITAAETETYEQATTTVSVTVNKAAVTIKAKDYTVKQGAALPTFDYTVTGLANGDTLSFTPVLTCETADTSTVGTYAITVTIEITEDECYTYTTKNGTLTVQKKSSGGGPTGPSAPTEPTNPSIGGSEKSWSDVAADLAKLANGSEITIELNGNTTVPVEVIKVIAEKKLKATFVVDSVKSWKTDGAEITAPAAADLTFVKTASQKHDGLRGIEGTQFKINSTNIPTDLEIAFKAEHAGKFANLYKSVDGKPVFVTCAKLGEDGKVILPDVVSKGDYVAMLCEFSDLKGDISNDGIMNAKDASAILKDIVEIEPGKNPLMADFNGDGKVNAMDAAAILKRIVGLA
ncbi:MAG: MBG domain-containing protein [Oscillospiraceae bacterium]